MSVNSETAPSGFLRRSVISAIVVSAILGVALVPTWPYVSQAASSANPHWPDMSVVWALSPVIKVHLYAALMALGLGAMLMGLRKGRRFHRIAGWLWVGLVATTAGSSLFITELNGDSWSFIHLLAGWTLILLPLAVFWAKRHNVKRHRAAMMGLFYGAFAINLIFTFIPGRTMWNVFFG